VPRKCLFFIVSAANENGLRSAHSYNVQLCTWLMSSVVPICFDKVHDRRIVLQ
jgi:hypothetical protein